MPARANDRGVWRGSEDRHPLCLIDTHCHLDVAEFAPDRWAVLERARAAGVVALVVPGIDAAGWPALQALCAAQPGLHPALGLHPLYLDRHDETRDLAALEHQLATGTLVAVGEIGLDRWGPDLPRQRRLVERQLHLARAAALPVLLHVRKAHDEMLTVLRSVRPRGGIVHAFNGSLDQARAYLDLGLRLGFGGMLTYERSTRLRRLARALPPTAFVLETDAPDLTVASHRYARNSPEYLPEILAALASVRAEDPAALAVATTRNACAALGLRADDPRWRDGIQTHGGASHGNLGLWPANPS